MTFANDADHAGEHTIAETDKVAMRRVSDIAHALRTELAIISLQLASIPDARARAAEMNIRGLARSIDALARVAGQSLPCDGGQGSR